MPRALFFLGVLLAAPLFSQLRVDPVVRQGRIEWFSINESRDELIKLIGEPARISDFGDDQVAWQYQIGVDDKHDFSHYVVFRKSTGKIVNITREYEEQRNVDEFFPETETRVCWFPDAEARRWPIRARTLSGGRVLMAMGTSKPGQQTTQLVLIRESELKILYPWVIEQLRKK